MQKKLNKRKLQKATLLLSTILNPLCKKIIIMLCEQEKPITVTELYQRVRAFQSDCSHSLRRLLDLDIVNIEVVGKFHFYSINRAMILKINNAMRNAKENGVIS